ncbi:pyruvate synthase subunit beta [Candidatus Woesearchaeota archaeon]|nr:pyruvate synthase subunit beta [Candidatus Woesearchaeota archaeon]
MKGIPDTELFAQGHNACAGCGASIIARHVLKASGKDVIVCNATGCLEVFSTFYPETSWKVPWIHAAFENAASVASGIARALKKQGREKTKVLVMGGDGGTFDIGFQFISGAVERGENICYVCYDNEAYMNTGIQRSGATPKYASTTTSPAGSRIHGKQEFKKHLPFIFAAHNENVYVATSSCAYPDDLIRKVSKGLEHKGPAYIQIFSSCPTGWKHSPSLSIKVAKLAFETCIYPLFEIEKGVVKITRKPGKIKPVKNYLQEQGRFKHLDDREVQQIQEHVNKQWEKLLKLEESGISIS